MSLLLAAVGSGPSPVSGSIAATQDSNTASLAGSVTASGVSGAISANQSNNTASVTVSEVFAGSASATQANNTASLTGVELFSGSISAPQAGNTASVTGSITGAGTSGSIAAAQDGNIASLTGSESFLGVIYSQQADNTSSASGSVSGGAVTGSISAFQADNTASTSGLVAVPVTGVITSIQGDNTASIAGLIDGYVTGYSNTIDLDRRWYVRRGKKLHIFNSGVEADAYLESEAAAEQAVLKAQKTSRLARKRLRNKIISVESIQTLEIPKLSSLVDKFNINVDLPNLIAQEAWDRVMQIHALVMEMQDEDDVEMLLLM